jgi:hypothetical protein
MTNFVRFRKHLGRSSERKTPLHSKILELNRIISDQQKTIAALKRSIGVFHPVMNDTQNPKDQQYFDMRMRPTKEKNWENLLEKNHHTFNAFTQSDSGKKNPTYQEHDYPPNRMFKSVYKEFDTVVNETRQSVLNPNQYFRRSQYCANDKQSFRDTLNQRGSGAIDFPYLAERETSKIEVRQLTDFHSLLFFFSMSLRLCFRLKIALSRRCWHQIVS